MPSAIKLLPVHPNAEDTRRQMPPRATQCRIKICWHNRVEAFRSAWAHAALHCGTLHENHAWNEKNKSGIWRWILCFYCWQFHCWSNIMMSAVGKYCIHIFFFSALQGRGCCRQCSLWYTLKLMWMDYWLQEGHSLKHILKMHLISAAKLRGGLFLKNEGQVQSKSRISVWNMTGPC